MNKRTIAIGAAGSFAAFLYLKRYFSKQTVRDLESLYKNPPSETVVELNRTLRDENPTIAIVDKSCIDNSNKNFHKDDVKNIMSSGEVLWKGKYKTWENKDNYMIPFGKETEMVIL